MVFALLPPAAVLCIPERGGTSEGCCALGGGGGTSEECCALGGGHLRGMLCPGEAPSNGVSGRNVRVSHIALSVKCFCEMFPSASFSTFLQE